MFVDSIIRWFLPRENRFFVYLDSIAKSLTVGADAFAELRQAKKEDFKRIATTMRQREHESDELAHLLYEELDKTFVTPIDREDLHALTSALDEVMDAMERCSAQIVMYKLEKLTDPMLDLIRIAQEATHEVAKCVALLQNIGAIDEIQVHVIHVNSLENEGDRVYRKALEHLFDITIDPTELFRQKEILDALEESIDACEDVIDLIRSVVVKNG